MKELKVLCGLLVLSTILSCNKNLQKEQIVYQNNFEEHKVNGIYNAIISDYNGSNVLGRYNTGGFDLSIDELPPHDLIQVSFDLNIHDNWSGNSLSGIKDSSDIWIMNFDGANEKYTTFSNRVCPGADCNFQAYPGNYPFPDNPPAANAVKTDLPGGCSSQTGRTTRYRITRTTYHTSSTFHLGCYAQLFAHQKAPDPLCEASWSVDNLVIKVIKFGD